MTYSKMTENLSQPTYRSDIDGLRALAVLAVVMFHAFPSSLRGGFAGVDVFFVISGFLISTIIFQNIDREMFSITGFYSRRIRRIFPALVLVLFSVLFLGWLCLFPEELTQLEKHVSASAGFIQNLALWKESGYFDNASETKPLLHIWSLGIEEQFYFIWPVLLYAAAKIGGRHKKLFYFLATFLVFIVSFSLNLHSIKIDPTKTFYLPQYRFWELAVGGMLAWAVFYRPRVSFKISQENSFPIIIAKKWLKNSLALLGIGILLAVFITFNHNTIFPGKMALLPVFATALIIFAGQEAFFNKKILSHKILVWFGLISFPLYLWHWPLLSFGQIIYGEKPTNTFRVLAVIVSILLSWLTVKIVEKPFRYGNKGINLKISLLCFLMIVIGSFGYYASKKEIPQFLNASEKETQQIISMSENNCKKKYPDWVGKKGTNQWCRLEKEINTIAIVGDSHAGHLYHGFVDTLQNTKESVAVFPASCAAPFLNVSTSLTDLASLQYRKNNWKLENKAFDYIGNNPSVHTVYLAHNPECSFAKGDAVDIENPAEKNPQTVLKNGLVRTLKFLTAKNKNVVIVLDNPIFKFDPKKCVSRGAFLDRFKTGCEVAVNSPAGEQYKKMVNEVVSSQFPNVKVVDLRSLFCHAGKCSPVLDGKLLYADSGHFNAEGSKYVAEYLLKASQ